MKLRISTPLAIALFALPACSGGGGGSSSSALPAINPTSAPTSSSTSVPLSSKRIGGAPLTATLAQLNSGRRTQSQGVTNGLPILVESSGMIAAWAGDQAVWVTSSITNADVAEASGTITPSGTLPITNPGFAPLSCLGSVSAVCITHPTGFEFGTSSANGKSVGKQTLAIAFNDGTSGTTADYVYDGWSLPCNTGFAYVSGVPVAQATQATSDVYLTGRERTDGGHCERDDLRDHDAGRRHGEGLRPEHRTERPPRFFYRHVAARAERWDVRILGMGGLVGGELGV